MSNTDLCRSKGPAQIKGGSFVSNILRYIMDYLPASSPYGARSGVCARFVMCIELCDVLVSFWCLLSSFSVPGPTLGYLWLHCDVLTPRMGILPWGLSFDFNEKGRHFLCKLASFLIHAHKRNVPPPWGAWQGAPPSP